MEFEGVSPVPDQGMETYLSTIEEISKWLKFESG